jgi:hypothetical protein
VITLFFINSGLPNHPRDFREARLSVLIRRIIGFVADQSRGERVEEAVSVPSTSGFRAAKRFRY